MDPLTITASTASLLTVTTRCITSLIKWGAEVKSINHSIRGFCAEIKNLQSVLKSLEAATTDKQSIEAVLGTNSGKVLWLQVNQTIENAQDAVESLDNILNGLGNESNGFFNRAQRQFKRSLESGEIATLRERIRLLSSTLALPLQMINIQLQISTGETARGAEVNLSRQIGDMQSAIDSIHVRLQSPTTPNPASADIYSPVKDIAEIAQGFASTASVYGASSSTVVGSQSPGSGQPATRPFQGSTQQASSQDAFMAEMAAASLLGVRLQPERHEHILNWIPPKPKDAICQAGEAEETGAGPSSSTPFLPLERLSLVDSRELSTPRNLDMELHRQRLGRGMALLEAEKFGEAARFFGHVLKRMVRRRSSGDSGTLALENDVSLLLARAQIGEKKDDEAETTLRGLLDAVDQDSDPVAFSASHYLAEIACRRDSLDEAENSALQAARGRHRVLGPKSAEYHSSVRLLVNIYFALEDPDEAEIWAGFLPRRQPAPEPASQAAPQNRAVPASLHPSRAEVFMAVQKEVCQLLDLNKEEEAMGRGVEFLKEAYPIIDPYRDRHRGYSRGWIRWHDIRENIRRGWGSKRGFVSWSSGMCVLHLLAVSEQDATSEIQFLLESGTDIECTTSLPRAGPENNRQISGGTPLMLAARVGNLDTVRLLVAKGASATRDNGFNGMNSLAYAAASGDEHTVEFLWILQPSRLAKCAALNAACIWGHTHLVQWFLARGLEATDRTLGGFSPLHCAASRDVSLVNFLLSQGAPVNTEDNEGQTPLFAAIRSKSRTIIRCLIDRGADLEARDKRERTPLLLAASYGTKTSFRCLLKFGANIDAVDKRGNNCLSLASRQGHEAIVHLLLTEYKSRCKTWIMTPPKGTSAIYDASRCSNVSIIRSIVAFASDLIQQELSSPASTTLDNEDCTAKLRTLLLSETRQGETALHAAARHKSKYVLVYILDMLRARDPTSAAAFVNKPGQAQNATPLFLAVIAGSVACVAHLLALGADVTIRDEYGLTAAHIAAFRGDEEVLELLCQTLSGATGSRLPPSEFLCAALVGGQVGMAKSLLERGASVTELWHCEDGCATTPLHEAAGGRNLTMLRLVLDAMTEPGERPDIVDAKGFTPPMHAAISVEYIDILLSQGPSPRFKVSCGTFAGMTAAHFAAESGKVECLEALLRHAPYEAFDRDEKPATTLLQAALSYGRLEMAKFLVELDPNSVFRVLKREEKDVSHLGIAVACMHGDCVRLICEVMSKLRSNWRLWQEQVQDFDIVIQAASAGNVKSMEVLLEFGFDGGRRRPY